MLISTAWAQASTTPQQPTFLENMFPVLLIFIAFYFFVIRPQARQKREHQKTLETLKKGDSVLTLSGILGRIEGLTEKYVTLEIDQGVKVKILRSQIAGLAKEDA